MRRFGFAPVIGLFQRFGTIIANVGKLALTIVEREDNGTVTVVELGPTWVPILTREGDGTVTVSAESIPPWIGGWFNYASNSQYIPLLFDDGF